MNEQWVALARQIRALKTGLADAERRAAEAHNVAAQALQQVAMLTRERDQYKALCDLHDAQHERKKA
jgi:hypothetical protein